MQSLYTHRSSLPRGKTGHARRGVALIFTCSCLATCRRQCWHDEERRHPTQPVTSDVDERVCWLLPPGSQATRSPPLRPSVDSRRARLTHATCRVVETGRAGELLPWQALGAALSQRTLISDIMSIIADWAVLAAPRLTRPPATDSEDPPDGTASLPRHGARGGDLCGPQEQPCPTPAPKG